MGDRLRLPRTAHHKQSFDIPSSLELAAAVVAAQQEILSAVTDLDKVLQVVVRSTPQVTGSAGAVVELVEGDELVYRAAREPRRSTLVSVLPSTQAFPGRRFGSAILRKDGSQITGIVNASMIDTEGSDPQILGTLVAESETPA